MEHIRFLKTQKDYDANTRHCLYGLDADLIMLGLCTHERHFSLLREEVKFGKKNNKAVPVDQQRFFLLHLSLMREYLEQEFIALKDNLKFKFDIENIIDDWVLMGFLVGNDFIPNIPNLHINSNALPMLYETYIRTLPSLDGYINEGGQLNLTRLQKYIENLAEFDRDNFSSTYDDLKFLETKHQGGFNDRNDDTFGGNSDLMNMVKATEFEFDSSPEENDENDMPFMNAEKDLSDDELFEKEFHQHRRNYYVNKMKYEEMTPAVLAEQAECYIRALQWTLSYYYHGVQSWGWFYPHHYAPFISDLKNFKNFTIDFEMGKPFLPFQQLMSVLPAASREHVPVPYQKLMTNPDSELIDFYPTNFETDLNGKKQEWEAVVLIPFIEEERLLKTLQKCDVELSAEERARNVHGPMYVYTYASTSQGSVDGPGTFPSIGHVMCNEKKIFREEIQVPKDKLVLGPSKGTFTNVYYSGFPTLKHLNYTSVVKKQSVKVFDQPSRGDSMIIVVSANEDELDAPPTDVLAKQLIGKTVHVGWPHLIEARIVKIADNMNVYTSDEVERMEGNRWSSDICSIKDHHKNRMGIEVGDIKRIVYAAPVTGEEYKFDPQLKIFRLIRTFSRHENAYPLQCIVQNINAYRKKFKKEIPLVEAFKNGTEVFMLTNPYYGAFGEVVDVNCYEKTGRIKVLLTVPQEPSFEDIYELHERNEGSYLNAYNLSAALNISENVINRITGSVLVIAGNKRMVTEGTSKVNIGLQLKFPKQNEELAGYTKKDRMWFYSEKATKLIEEYYSKYPSVFAVLGRNTGGNDIYYESDFFLTTEGEENLSTLLKWLGTLPHRKADRRPVGSESVEKDVLEAIIKSLDKTKDSPLKKITMQVKLHLLYVPTLQKTSKSPDPRSQFYLFDRIVIAKGTDKMPVGLKGTVIGINRVKDLNPVRQDCINKEDIYCEILFDSEISDGLNLYGIAKNRVARVVIENLINISYGESLTQTISTNVKPAPVSRSRYTETKKPNGATRQNYAQNASQQAFSAIMQKNENGNSNKPKFADMWNALKNSGDDTKKSSTVVQQRNVMPTNAWNNMKNGPSGQTKEQEPFQHSPSPAIDRKPQPKDTSDDVNKQIESINLNNNSVPYVAPPANLPAPPMEWIKGTSESHTKPKPELSKQRPTVMPPQAGFIKVPQAYQTMPPQNFFPVSLPMNAGPVPMMTSQFQGTSLMNTAPANLPYNHNITGPPPGAYYRNGNGQQNPPGQFFTNNQGRNYFVS